MDKVVSRATMLERLRAHYGPIDALREDSTAPADRYVLPDGTVFGIISSTTAPFCRSCDRARLTADGMWYLCLYANRGIDLRAALRSGASLDEMKTLIAGGWQQRADRGAEDRLRSVDRRALAEAAELRRDPHLEMHTRGG
jgi:cyclic pyranopterin phosphate synthase